LWTTQSQPIYTSSLTVTPSQKSQPEIIDHARTVV
jgi:hypothetical protein